MLRSGIPIGRAFGISLRLHYSWFFIFVLVTWALAASYFPSTCTTWSLSTRIAAGMITSVLFFGSVLVHESILTSGRRCFPVVSDSQILGMMTLHNVKAIHREQWGTETVKEAMTPFEKLRWVRPDEELSSVIRILTEDDINQVPVVQDNQVVGMVSRENLLNFVNIRSGLGI